MKSFHRAAKKKPYRGIGQTHEPYNRGALWSSSRSNERAEKMSPLGSTGGSHGHAIALLFEDRGRLATASPRNAGDHTSDHLIEGVRLAIKASN